MTTPPFSPHKFALLNACTSASVLTFGNFTLKSGRQSPYFFNAGLLHTATLVDTVGAAYAATILDYIRQSSSSQQTTSSSSISAAAAAAAGGAGRTEPPNGQDPLQQQQQQQQQQRQEEDGEKKPPAFADFDVIFGPSYKGIPLAISTLSALHRLSSTSSPPPSQADYTQKSYAFNRKEAKSHGEGGNIVGSPLRHKRVLIVDDVVTAGTALREAVRIIEGEEGGKVVGVVVALDRMERMPSQAELEGRIEKEEGTEVEGREGDGEGGGCRRSAVQELRRSLGVPVLAVLTLDDLIGFAGLDSDAGGGGGDGEAGVDYHHQKEVEGGSEIKTKVEGGSEIKTKMDMQRLKAYRERYVAYE